MTNSTPASLAQWKTLKNMTKKRGMAGCLAVNDHQFLVIGGSADFDDDESHLASCEYYDTENKIWNRIRINIPAARSGFGVAAYGNQLYVMGGMTDPETYRSDLISINYEGDLSTLSGRSILTPKKWERCPPMRQPRALFACVRHSKYIYILGGVDENRKALDCAERYDTVTKCWEILASMPDQRFGCAAGVVGNKIYVVGGEDVDDNELASTVIFDISKQEWEETSEICPGRTSTPAVPNMKEKRGMLSVVVIEDYVFAIGGGDEHGQLSSTIEVLDTERNIWSYAKTKMKLGSCYQAAGYLKETGELILAGGANEEAANVTSLVESVNFETGLLPSRFRVKERAQKVIGDMSSGKDQLGVANIARALAETIVFKDLEPPFTLGILGKPGQGKTYFFNLMLEHLISIQKRPVDDLIRNTFAGHIYVVKFDAWTFSKGSIWTSLMFKILETLNEHLQFEDEMGDAAMVDGDISSIEVFRDLEKGDIRSLRKFSKLIRDAHQTVKKNGDRASEPLLKVINASYKQDQEDLRQIKSEIQNIQKRRIQEQAKSASKMAGKYIVKKSLKRALKNALEEKLIPEDDRSIDELIQNFDTSGDYDKLVEEIRIIKWWHYRFRAANIPAYGWICSAFFLILAGVLYLIYRAYAVITISGLISAFFPVVTNFSFASNQVQSLVVDFKVQAVESDDVEVGCFDAKDVEEMKVKEAKKEEIENRTLALKGSSLRDAIASKIDSRDYESNMGVVHKVQNDLQHLSDTMLNNRNSDVVFPRGDPRIVLFVEDLDRCEQSVVVEVIEALQLLVKTKLFVSVIAIDPRYASLSLEKHYKGVLDPQTSLSGMDYIEKVIQIPFCLPGVGQDFVDSFVRSQIEVDDSNHTRQSFEIVLDDKHSDGISVVSSTSSQIPSYKSTESSEDEAEEPLDNEALPKNRVMFKKAERKMMADMLKLFGMGPRNMRRMINVFKVLSVIWQRDSARFPVDYNLKRGTLFLMLLSSEETTREVTCTIFEMMEQGMVKYHQVMRDSEGALQSENNLANLFKTELEKRDNSFRLSFLLSATKDTSNKGTLVAHIEEYLSEYKWSSFEQWNIIASKFLLARCFSFSHLVSAQMNRQQQPLNMNHLRRMNPREADAKWNYIDFTGGILGSRSDRANSNDEDDEIHDLRWNSSPSRSTGAVGIETAPNHDRDETRGKGGYNAQNGQNGHSNHSRNGQNGHSNHSRNGQNGYSNHSRNGQNGYSNHSRNGQNGHSNPTGRNGINGHHKPPNAINGKKGTDIYHSAYNKNITVGESKMETVL